MNIPLNQNILREGFTLIELLVVIAIIAILAAMLPPALVTAKWKATRSKRKRDIYLFYLFRRHRIEDGLAFAAASFHYPTCFVAGISETARAFRS